MEKLTVLMAGVAQTTTSLFIECNISADEVGNQRETVAELLSD